MKTKLSQCNECNKTISDYNGVVKENICFNCKEKLTNEAKRKDAIRNLGKKRPVNQLRDLEKLANIVE